MFPGLLVLSAGLLFVGEREVVQPDPSGSVAASKPYIKLPPQVFVEPGKPFRIPCDSNCKKLRWTCPPIERLPAEWVKDPDRTFYGIAPITGGTLKFEVLGSLSDEWAEGSTIVIVGGTPPGPAPGPTPPTPNDPFFSTLQSLYTADKSPSKAAHAKALADVYRTGANVIKANKAIQTSEQLFDMLRAVSDAALPEVSGVKPLQTIRDAIRPEVAKCFSPGDLSDDTRVKGAECFVRISTLLEALK